MDYEDEIKIIVLIESIRQHSNRRITNRVKKICEEYIDNVVIDKMEDDFWITGIEYEDENGKRQVSIISEEKYGEMASRIFN